MDFNKLNYWVKKWEHCKTIYIYLQRVFKNALPEQLILPLAVYKNAYLTEHLPELNITLKIFLI